MNEQQEEKVYNLIYSMKLKSHTIEHIFWDLMDRKAVDTKILAEILNFNEKGD